MPATPISPLISQLSKLILPVLLQKVNFSATSHRPATVIPSVKDEELQFFTFTVILPEFLQEVTFFVLPEIIPKALISELLESRPDAFIVRAPGLEHLESFVSTELPLQGHILFRCPNICLR